MTVAQINFCKYSQNDVEIRNTPHVDSNSYKFDRIFKYRKSIIIDNWIVFLTQVDITPETVAAAGSNIDKSY